MHMLTEELTGVLQRHCNTERFIIFQIVIFQHACHVTGSSEIRWINDRRLYAGKAGEFELLAEDTTCTCAQYLSTSRREHTPEHCTKIFHSLVLQGKLL